MTVVGVSKQAIKDLSKAPSNIQIKFATWKLAVEVQGIEVVRQRSGFHDEPLKGKRKGQRSVRLNKQWRVIYVEVNEILKITVLEVNPHDY